MFGSALPLGCGISYGPLLHPLYVCPPSGNDGDTDRYVLLIRFWHPELTQKEREALLYIFKALEGEETQLELDYDYFDNIAAQQIGQRGGGGSA